MSIEKLAQDAMQVHNSVKSMDILAYGFRKVVRDLKRELEVEAGEKSVSMEEINTHPIIRLWAETIMDLSGGPEDVCVNVPGHIWEECERLAGGV